MNSEEEALHKEMFWYREALLETIRARWRELNGSKSGDLELRGQRLTPEMMTAFKLGKVQVDMRVLSEPKPPPWTAVPAFRARCLPNQFCYLQVKVTNRAS